MTPNPLINRTHYSQLRLLPWAGYKQRWASAFRNADWPEWVEYGPTGIGEADARIDRSDCPDRQFQSAR